MVSHVLSFGIAHARSFLWWYLIVCILALGPANSSVGRASDCSSEGRRLEPGLVHIETLLTQLVGSIPTRGTLCFIRGLNPYKIFNEDKIQSVYY